MQIADPTMWWFSIICPFWICWLSASTKLILCVSLYPAFINVSITLEQLAMALFLNKSNENDFNLFYSLFDRFWSMKPVTHLKKMNRFRSIRTISIGKISPIKTPLNQSQSPHSSPHPSTSVPSQWTRMTFTQKLVYSAQQTGWTAFVLLGLGIVGGSIYMTCSGLEQDGRAEKAARSVFKVISNDSKVMAKLTKQNESLNEEIKFLYQFPLDQTKRVRNTLE